MAALRVQQRRQLEEIELRRKCAEHAHVDLLKRPA
jgi:hypothetical protein